MQTNINVNILWYNIRKLLPPFPPTSFFFVFRISITMKTKYCICNKRHYNMRLILIHYISSPSVVCANLLYTFDGIFDIIFYYNKLIFSRTIMFVCIKYLCVHLLHGFLYIKCVYMYTVCIFNGEDTISIC